MTWVSKGVLYELNVSKDEVEPEELGEVQTKFCQIEPNSKGDNLVYAMPVSVVPEPSTNSSYIPDSEPDHIGVEEVERES